MNAEIRNCQNCKKNFTIEAEDFAYFEKLDVPVPIYCFQCRLQRLLLWRNERTLYRRKCDAPGHDEMLISSTAPETEAKIYDQKYWWSDAWDALEYGREYDFGRGFFEQFGELIKAVPRANLMHKNNVNSDYSNSAVDLKNCYLVFSSGWCEDCLYASDIDYSKDCLDMFKSIKDEQCCELIFTNSCSKVLFGAFSDNCLDSAFLFDCKGCSNCFGCVGLRNKSYHIFNKPYSREEYQEELKKFNLGSYASLTQVKKLYHEWRMQVPYKFSRQTHSVGSTGDNLAHTKNSRNCFDVIGEGLEDSAGVVSVFAKPVKDSHSVYTVGDSCSNIYNSISVMNSSNVMFSKKIWSSYNIAYSYNCHDSSDLFGCAGLRGKHYCIFNKQYSKEEYEKLAAQIKEHMRASGEYGEYFPPSLSPLSYNETIAQEYYPQSKESAAAAGLKWRDNDAKNYQITLKTEEIPDNIAEVTDAILNEVLACQHGGTCIEQCASAFRILPQELALYRKMNLALPRLCPNCRHYERRKLRNPLQLWHRKCMKAGCENEFETSYAPDRPEIVYCESCYQNEVV